MAINLETFLNRAAKYLKPIILFRNFKLHSSKQEQSCQSMKLEIYSTKTITHFKMG